MSDRALISQPQSPPQQGSGRSAHGATSRSGGRHAAPIRPRSVAPGAQQLQLRSDQRVAASIRVAADVAVPFGVAVQRPELALGSAAFAMGILMVGQWFGFYRARFTQHVMEQLARLLVVVAGGCAFATLVLPLVGHGRTPDLFRMGILTFVMMATSRGVIYSLERRRRSAGRRLIARTLVIGDGPGAHRLMRYLREHPELGLRLVGTLGATGSGGRVKNLGTMEDMPRVLNAYDISVVVLAFPDVDQDKFVEVVRRCSLNDVEIYAVPDGYSTRARHDQNFDQVWSIPITRVTPARLSGLSWIAKRVVDVIGSACALVLLAPVLLLVAAAVRIEGGPGVIFRQIRVGRGGRPITLYKFRSMRATADESSTTWSIAGDNRVGPVGRFIRATSLDELPQFFNVLRGDMSLVGPRPERPYFVDQYGEFIPQYRQRHRAPVGMTGYAAIHGLRGDTSIDDRTHFDNGYIDNWSLSSDARIAARTLPAMFGRRGA